MRSRLVVLIYHRVLEAPDPLRPATVHAAQFERHMAALARWFRPMPLAQAVAALYTDTLPSRAVCVTFDDGYADNYARALPILQRHGVPATFFVATDYLDGGRMWNDTVTEVLRTVAEGELDLEPLGLGRHVVGPLAGRGALVNTILRQIKYLPAEERPERVAALAAAVGGRLPDDLMMTSAQVRELARHMDIGGHTMSHPILTRLDPDTARREIADGRDRLREITGSDVNCFAYPNGRPGTDYDASHVRIVADLGFTAAVSTAWGAARPGHDRFQVPRIGSWDAAGLRFAARVARTWFQPPAAVA